MNFYFTNSNYFYKLSYPPINSSTEFHYDRITVGVRIRLSWCMRPRSKEIQTNPWHLPVISICRRVSTIFSVTSSCIRVSLLFCRFNVSNEFKFSKTNGGNTLILKIREKRRERLYDDNYTTNMKRRFVNEIMRVTNFSGDWET